MIELKYKGGYFDLYPDTRIPLEINNPIFDEDLISGSYSFPFRMPLTARTRRLLGTPDEINNITPFPRKLDGVQLIVDGVYLYTGTLVIRSVTLNEVDAYLLVGNSAVNDYASKTKVADVISYNKSFTGPDEVLAHMTATTQGTVNEFPYVFFPVGNPVFYPGTPEPLSQVRTMQNFYYVDKFRVKEELEDVSAPQVQYQENAVTPFPYITFLLREALKPYKVGHNIFELDPELQRLVLYNNVGLARYVKEERGSRQIWVNMNDRAIELKDHVPAETTVADLIIGMKNIFCLYFYSSLLDGEISYGSLRDLLERPVELNWTSKTEPSAEISNDFALGVKYVPDYKGDDAADILVKSIKGKKILPFSKAPQFPDPKDTTIYYDDAKGEYVYADYIFYLLYSSAMTDFYLQEAEFEVKHRITPLLSALTTILNDPFDPNAFRAQRVPFVMMPGKYYDKDGKIHDASTAPRVTFYRGYQGDNKNDLYPYGSSHNSNFHGVKTGEYSLAWEGEYGLHKVWWRRYLAMRRFGRKVKKEIRLSLSDLANLDLLKKVRIENANYLIKKINLELPLVTPAKVELWKTE